MTFQYSTLLHGRIFGDRRPANLPWFSFEFFPYAHARDIRYKQDQLLECHLNSACQSPFEVHGGHQRVVTFCETAGLTC